MSSRAYHSWYDARRRCSDPRRPEWLHYGGKGIRMCKRWRESFTDFLEDVGTPPTDKHTLDRIDSEKGYEPGNVRWATRKEQTRNRKVTRMLTHNGETLSFAEWAEKLGIPFRTLKARIDKYGWTVERALTP